MVKDSRITKPDSPSQSRPGRCNTVPPFGPPADHHSQHGEQRSLTQFETTFEDPAAARIGSKTSGDSSLDPESLSSLVQGAQYLESIIGNSPTAIEIDQNVRSAVKAVESLAKVGIDNGWFPCLGSERPCSCKHHPPSATRTKREEQAARKAILDQAARDSPDKDGKPLPAHRVLAGYGRREFPLSGQMAVIHELERKSGCKECQRARLWCITVEQDKFWNRNQCVECVQRKSMCSLDTSKSVRPFSPFPIGTN